MSSLLVEVEAPAPTTAMRITPQRTYALAILAVAVIVRLGVVLAVSGNRPETWFFGAGNELGNVARSLLTGHGFSSPFGGSTGPTAFLAPGYAPLIAAVFAVFGPFSHASAMFLMTLQALFGAATVLVLMLLADRVFGGVAANIAGLVWALCPCTLFLPLLCWETSLSILLAISIPALALVAARPADPNRSSVPIWIGMGLLAATVVTVNPSLLPILAGCYGWALYEGRHRSWRAPAIGIVIAVALSLPWTIRNAVKLHAFIPIRTNAGYELWQGNRPGADGFFDAKYHPTTSPSEFARYQALGEVAYMQEKSAQAHAAIAANPARFVGLSARRAFFFWLGIDKKPHLFETAYVIATSALGLFGLTLLWRRNRSLAIFFLLPLLLFPAIYYITHPDVRFRMILDPLLIILSAYALTPRRTGTALLPA